MRYDAFVVELTRSDNFWTQLWVVPGRGACATTRLSGGSARRRRGSPRGHCAFSAGAAALLHACCVPSRL